jgi:hypothetical protein
MTIAEPLQMFLLTQPFRSMLPIMAGKDKGRIDDNDEK